MSRAGYIARGGARLAQRVLDQSVVQQRNGGAAHASIGLAIRVARRALIRMGDPEVTYRFGDTTMRLSLSHELPIYRAQHPAYGTGIARIASIVAQKYPDLAFIDVGANVGDTVLFVREKAHFSILCVEADAAFCHLLRKNVSSLADIEIAEVLLDQFSGRAPGRLVAAHGTARLLEDFRGQSVVTSTLADLLERHERFRNPKIVKIDTDGMDARILSGSAPVLERSRPVLAFEYDPYLAAKAGSDLVKAIADLRDLGYRRALVYVNTGDYSHSLSLADRLAIEELDTFYRGRRGDLYADLYVFHADDEDLWQVARTSEIRYFKSARSLEA